MANGLLHFSNCWAFLFSLQLFLFLERIILFIPCCSMEFLFYFFFCSENSSHSFISHASWFLTWLSWFHSLLSMVFLRPFPLFYTIMKKIFWVTVYLPAKDQLVTNKVHQMFVSGKAGLTNGWPVILKCLTLLHYLR